MRDNIAIKVDDVSKTFKLPHEKNTSIKSAVVSFYKRNRTFETQKALSDISFEIKQGEFFGIVGRNGSGKSTLLKLIAGIYSPSKGAITVNGKLTPFIELGVGFNPELTGRENVFLNGALLGFNRKEMDAMYKEIVDFAELHNFMDQKLKNYSSGMQVRLAFSIAIRAKSDVLLIDEVLAVGDASFQQKCYEIFSDLQKVGRTIVLVTHDMSAVLRFCDRALLINDGIASEPGEPKDVADAYLELNYQATPAVDVAGKVKSNQKQIINSVSMGNGIKKISVSPGQREIITMDYTNNDTQPVHFGMQIFNEAGNYCFGTNTKINDMQPSKLKKGKIKLDINLNLLPGNYTVTAAIMNRDATKVLAYLPKATTFRVTNTTDIEGIANLSHKWTEAYA